MANLPSRLDRLRPAIESLMHIGGTPGLALAVVSGGESVYTATFGHRNITAGLSISDETVFPVCSLTKAVTAAAMGILVEEGKIGWDTLVKDVLPTFDSRDETLQNFLTIADLLSHRSGMAWSDNLVIGAENNILIRGKDRIKYINAQQRLLPFRGQFAYNNLPYDLAGSIIEQISGQSWSKFLKTRILDPLGMERTFLKPPPPGTTNVTECYNTLDDLTTVPIPCPKAGNDGFAGPSGGMWSCVRDLQKLYAAYGRSFKDQFETGKTSTDGSPFKQIAHLASAKIPMDQPSRCEISYACGWGRVQLPNRMGQIGLNPGLVRGGMPVIGKGVPSQLVLFHQGSLPGALAIVMLLPDSDNIIIVLTNSLALTDVPDWVGQLVLEELLEVPEHERVDFLAFAKAAVAENLKWYPKLIMELDAAQTHGTSPRNLEEYVGVYWIDAHIFKIAVTLEDGRLFWAFQGLDSEKYELKHYEDDTFIWLLPRNELSRRGRWVGSDQVPVFWKAEFRATSGCIGELYWEHDTGVPALKFTKDLSTHPSFLRSMIRWVEAWTLT